MQCTLWLLEQRAADGCNVMVITVMKLFASDSKNACNGPIGCWQNKVTLGANDWSNLQSDLQVRSTMNELTSECRAGSLLLCPWRELPYQPYRKWQQTVRFASYKRLSITAVKRQEEEVVSIAKEETTDCLNLPLINLRP